MPDWSYRTILRPLLFRFPPSRARRLALGAMGRLGRLPGGPQVIELFGHMSPSPRLRRSRGGITFPSPVAIGAAVDPEAIGVHALAQFGAAFVETGPVTPRPATSAGGMQVDLAREAIVLAENEGLGVEAMVARLKAMPRRRVPLALRLAVPPDTKPPVMAGEYVGMIRALAAQADLFTVPAEAPLADIVTAAHALVPPRAVLAIVRPQPDTSALDAPLALALAAPADGVLIDGAVADGAGRREIGRPLRDVALASIARARQRLGPRALIVGGAGIHDPQDALAALKAGADVVTVDSGLVLTGPGLPKRINEAVLAREAAAPAAEETRAPARAWFWTFLMGAGMLLGSLMAMAIAMTRVVLPYDEQFVGMTRAQLTAVNDRLLPFMTHDRVALAGTMVAIGVLYSGLSFFGVRRGQHWAWVAVVSSAAVGFASFFLFLGFGYFDPFHALVTALLFQFLVLGVHAPLGEPHEDLPPDLRNDRAWYFAQWGQLLLIAHAVALFSAGLVISGVGITTVFVPEDLEFMRTTRATLAEVGPHLIPLVAHDRATFGGMLVVAGLTFLMTALWGIRRGRAWLWWTTLLAGIPGYAGGIGVHYAVGYHNPLHLAPAFAGLALFAAAMTLCRPFLCQRHEA